MATATIVLRDEVNIQINGLSAETRRRLSKQFSYDIPGARFTPAVRLGRWDGKTTYFTLSGSTFVNLLPEILPVLEEEKYEVTLDDQRQYDLIEFEFEQINEDSFNHITWPKGHQLAGQPIKLRDYQVDAVNKGLFNPQSIHALATGAGKTLITAALSQRCEKYGRTFVIVPNKTLIGQTEADYRNLQLDVGVYYGDRKEFGHKHTICTWQSLNVLLKSTKAGNAEITIQEFVAGVCCVIIDECHMATAAVLKDLLCSIFSKCQIRWGLTGTIPKEMFEFRSLQVSLGEVVNKIQASELQESGVLANCHVNITQMIDYVEYKEWQDELKYLLDTEVRQQWIAGLIEKISITGNTLVLVDRIEPGKKIASFIPDAVFVSGTTKSGDRQEQYDDIAISSNKVLIATYGIASVGLNVPKLHNVVLIEPGKSFVRVIQSIGRGLRKAEGKDGVTIWDICSTTKYSKRHLTKRKEFYREADYPFTIKKHDWQGK